MDVPGAGGPAFARASIALVLPLAESTPASSLRRVRANWSALEGWVLVRVIEEPASWLVLGPRPWLLTELRKEDGVLLAPSSALSLMIA